MKTEMGEGKIVSMVYHSWPHPKVHARVQSNVLIFDLERVIPPTAPLPKGGCTEVALIRTEIPNFEGQTSILNHFSIDYNNLFNTMCK